MLIRENYEVRKLVKSSDGKRTYVVSCRQGTWACSCPVWKFQRGEFAARHSCKHIERVREAKPTIQMQHVVNDKVVIPNVDRAETGRFVSKMPLFNTSWKNLSRSR